MKIAQGIATLELGRETSRPIYPTLLWDADSATLIDTGFPNMRASIRDELAKNGVPFEKLTRIILTHQDIDHIGSLPDLLRDSPAAIEVAAHTEEKPYIQGDKPLIKANPAQGSKMTQSMPPERRAAFEALLRNPPAAPVTRTLSDGEELPEYGGLVVIHTPGHTPGHICLYHRASKTLIAGDALTAPDGVLLGPRPQVAADIALARRSLEKLLPFEITQVVCYHGGICSGTAEAIREKIEQLAHEN